MGKIYTVTIGGSEIKIQSEQSEEFIGKIVDYINQKLDEVVKANSKISASTAILLTALNTAEDLFLEREASDRIREQVTNYSSEFSKYKYQMLEYKNKYEKAKKELGRNEI